jgi:hypothetical protein
MISLSGEFLGDDIINIYSFLRPFDEVHGFFFDVVLFPPPPRRLGKFSWTVDASMPPFSSWSSS